MLLTSDWQQSPWTRYGGYWSLQQRRQMVKRSLMLLGHLLLLTKVTAQ